MEARKNEIDSNVLGSAVVEILDFTVQHDFADFERSYTAKHHPRYVVCKLPVEDLSGIHALEDAGFRFVEYQIRSELRLRERYATKSLPYVYEPVTSEADLEPVFAIAEDAFTDDRFTVDPEIPSELGGKRYRAYVMKSLIAEDEFVHKLANPDTGETIGFNTCRQLSDTQMLLLIAGVKSEYKSTGLGTVLNYYVFNDFLDRGVNRVRTHQSGRNYPILNVEIGHFNFRVVQTFAVLRKLY